MTTAVDRVPRAGVDASALLAVQARSEKTTELYRSEVRRFASWCGDRSVSVEGFEEYVRDLLDQGCSAARVKLAVYGIKAGLLQAAERQGMQARELSVLKGALDSVKPPKQGSTPITTVTKAERDAMIRLLPEEIGLVVRFLYATAARVTEALQVRESDVHVEVGIARIRLLGKGSKERWVKIPLQLLREINTVYQFDGRKWLFTNRATGSPWTRRWITMAIGSASKSALGRQISAHDLRHSRATDLYQKTKRLKAVSEMLGHSGTAVTAQFYVRDELTNDELMGGEEL
jgi:integrase